MTFGRRSVVLLVVFLLLILGYLLLGYGSGPVSGRARAFDLLPVEVDAAVPANMPGDGSHDDAPEDKLPPESTLDNRDTTLSSEGQILGLWEPSGFFSGSNYSGIKSRTRGPLTLTDGELLAVSSGATLKFRYGSEVDLGRDVFDALAFEISDGELSRAEDAKTGELRYLEALPKTRPLVLIVDVPEITGQEAVGVRMDMPPGVYVVSMSVSVEEGNARYNFRVVVK